MRRVTEVPETEFSEVFTQGMYDRMATSYFKYGPVTEAYPSRVDAIASLEKRLERYKETGNTEWLMDVANFAMIESMHPRHPKAHFHATDSHESPGRVWQSGEQSARRNDLGSNERYYRHGGD